MHVWLISAFEPLPVDQTRSMRFMGIADILHQRGHKITLWSSTYNHFTKSQRFPADQDLKIKPNYDLKLVFTKPYKRNISLGRLMSHGDFAKKMIRRLSSEPKPDLIYLAFPPIGLFKEVAEYSKYKHIPLIVDIIDPWPDVFLNILPEFLRKPSKLAFIGYYRTLRKAFSSTAAIFSISGTYINWAKRLACRSGIEYGIFYPAVDTSSYPSLNDMLPAKPVRFIYAGTLGSSYDVQSIIEVARKVTGEKAEFIIAGDGPNREKLERMASQLNHVHFTGWLNGERLREELSKAHVGIAAYRKRGTQTVTYKLFDYLSAGLPIVSSLDGEMRAIIEKNNLGHYFEAENTDSLESAISFYVNIKSVELLQQKKHVKKFAEKNGDIHVVYGKLVENLENLLHEN